MRIIRTSVWSKVRFALTFMQSKKPVKIYNEAFSLSFSSRLNASATDLLRDLLLPRAAHARARGYVISRVRLYIYLYIYISVCHHEKHEFSNYRQLLAL